MSKEDDQIKIPLKDILKYATQARVSNMIGVKQPYIYRMKSKDFGLIVEVVGTYENLETKFGRRKTKTLNRVPHQKQD